MTFDEWVGACAAEIGVGFALDNDAVRDIMHNPLNRAMFKPMYQRGATPRDAAYELMSIERD